QFGTNHLGHFALTGQLLDNILPVEGSRVVTVSSFGHRILARIHFDDLQLERKYNRVEAYGQSKLANLLFTYELQRRFKLKGDPTVALAAHPGFADTELMRHLPGFIPDFFWRPFAQPTDMGALPTLRAATDPGAQGGQYYGPDGIGEVQGSPKAVESSKQSHNEDLQRRLWMVSEELTGVTYPV
ncbi:MAG TPA: oxidoreductase, partial [Mycobacterium sp.]|nr:oxidoreductase [Mycobacterium sp.]